MRSTRPLQPLAGLYRRYLDTIGHLARAWCPTLTPWTERRLDILDTLDTAKEPIQTLTHSNVVRSQILTAMVGSRVKSYFQVSKMSKVSKALPRLGLALDTCVLQGTWSVSPVVGCVEVT